MDLKFENVDIEKCLRSVMEKNTKHYQSDFDFDVGTFQHIAQAPAANKLVLYWMSRPSGTWCFMERDLFIRDSQAFHTWQYYKDSRDTILSYAVEITGMSAEGHIMGNLYTQDYREVTKHLECAAQNAASVSIRFEGQSEPMKFSYTDYKNNSLSIHARFGKAETFRLEPEDPLLLKDILQKEKMNRQKFITGDFEKHADKIMTGEKISLTRYLKETAPAVRSPSSKSAIKEQPDR